VPRARGRHAPFGLVVAAVVLFCLADTVYLVRVAQGTWESGGPVEAGWWLASLFFAAAAWQPRRAAGLAMRSTGYVVIAMPTAFATVALAVLVAGGRGRLNPLAVLLATASLVAVMLRLVLTFQQHSRTLSRLRRQAHTTS